MNPAEGANSVGPTHSRPTRNSSVSGSGLQKEDATTSRREQAMKGTDTTNTTDPAPARLNTEH